MSAIAIIGFGSLIWDLETLADHVAGEWRLGAGPALPLEFSYVSNKRLGALTVVVDPTHGERRPTAAIASVRESVEDAAIDLARRERASRRAIGVWRAEDPAPESPAHAAIAAWARESGWRAAVWTAAQSNFEARTGAPFSLGAAERHLSALDGPALIEAKRYIANAPAETDTPLRRALAAKGWI